MTKTKKKRWVCPQCGVGKLGLQRPRKNDIIRYCFPCSEKAGVLVERVSPADINKKKKKEEAAARKKANAKPKPRKTTRTWMQIPRYRYESSDGSTPNLMFAASVMCRMSGWNNPKRLKQLWDRTSAAMRKPYKPERWDRIITYTRSTTRGYSSGRAYGGSRVEIMLSCDNIAASLVTLLHELCHIDQDNYQVVNGVRRPHDLAFNLKQQEMAYKMWGYNTHPECAGWSVGKGYAPTRHLERWLLDKIKEEDPKVMDWIKTIVF